MISLSDLRTCPMAPIFFDTFFNLEKYLDHEQRDPFASQRDLDEDGNEVNFSFGYHDIVLMLLLYYLNLIEHNNDLIFILDVRLGQICRRGVRIISCRRRKCRRNNG